MGVKVTAEQPFIVGQVVTSSASFTRPNNTTTYAAGETLSSIATAGLPTYMTFDDIAPTANGTACIQMATCLVMANQTLQPDLQLFLYSAPPPMQADNAAFAATNDQLNTLIACIAFPVAGFVVTNAGSGAAGNCMCNAQGLVIPFNVPENRTIYGHLVVQNAYIPVAVTQFTIRLNVVN